MASRRGQPARWCSSSSSPPRKFPRAWTHSPPPSPAATAATRAIAGRGSTCRSRAGRHAASSKPRRTRARGHLRSRCRQLHTPPPSRGASTTAGSAASRSAAWPSAAVPGGTASSVSPTLSGRTLFDRDGALAGGARVRARGTPDCRAARPRIDARLVIRRRVRVVGRRGARVARRRVVRVRRIVRRAATRNGAPHGRRRPHDVAVLPGDRLPTRCTPRAPTRPPSPTPSASRGTASPRHGRRRRRRRAGRAPRRAPRCVARRVGARRRRGRRRAVHRGARGARPRGAPPPAARCATAFGAALPRRRPPIASPPKNRRHARRLRSGGAAVSAVGRGVAEADTAASVSLDAARNATAAAALTLTSSFSAHRPLAVYGVGHGPVGTRGGGEAVGDDAAADRKEVTGVRLGVCSAPRPRSPASASNSIFIAGGTGGDGFAVTYGAAPPNASRRRRGPSLLAGEHAEHRVRR